MRISKCILLILSFILIFSLISCGNSKKSEEQDENPVPRELKLIEESIESVLASLSDPSLSKEERQTKQKSESESEKSTEQKGGQESSQKESDKEETKQGQEGQPKKGGEQQSSQGLEGSKQDSEGSAKGKAGDRVTDSKQSEQNQSKANWEKIDKTIREIHTAWNSYLPKAVKDGVSSDLTDSFGEVLNDLTKLSKMKNNAELLLSANKLYSYIPQTLANYDTPVHPGIKKVKYYVRNVVYNANIEDWDQAMEDAQKLESVWSATKEVVGKKQKDDVEKLNFAIRDLSKVTDMKNKELVFIKGEITMENVKDIEKAIEEKAKSQKSKK